MSMLLNPDENAPPVRADPTRMAGLTVRAVDQIGNGAAREIDAVADKLEADAAEGVARLRRLADALREHSRIAGDYVAGVLDNLADVVSTSRDLQSRLEAAARKSNGNGGDPVWEPRSKQMKQPKDSITLEQAIELIMKNTGCSRRAARKKLHKAVKDKKLPIHKAPLVEKPFLTPDQAIAKFEEDPEQVSTPLDTFYTVADFTVDELMGELKSGRLCAHATESVLMSVMVLKQSVPAHQFSVTTKAIVDWMTNPKTPPHLIEKWRRGMDARPC